MKDSEKKYDVIGWGVVAVDDLFHVPALPKPDSKVMAISTDRRIGGLTAVALLAACELGGKAAFAGVLGGDPLSRFVTDALAQGGVDVSHLVMLPDARPVHAVVVVCVKDGSRTIYYTTEKRKPRGSDEMLEDLVDCARTILVDPFSLSEGGEMLEYARKVGVPVIADLEDEYIHAYDDLLPLIDHMVMPIGAAKGMAGTDDPEEAAASLAQGRVAAVVTAGKQGCWFASGDAPSQVGHQPIFEVEARNTTGCGDVFHGAYALAVAREWTLDKAVEFASAAAAVRAEDSAPTGAVTDCDRVEELIGRAMV